MVYLSVITSDLPDVSDLACKYNVDEDSQMYIELWRVENEMDSEPETPKPSSMSGYSETAELVRCPVTQQFMAVSGSFPTRQSLCFG